MTTFCTLFFLVIDDFFIFYLFVTHTSIWIYSSLFPTVPIESSLTYLSNSFIVSFPRCNYILFSSLITKLTSTSTLWYFYWFLSSYKIPSITTVDFFSFFFFFHFVSFHYCLSVCRFKWISISLRWAFNMCPELSISYHNDHFKFLSCLYVM